MRRFLSIVLPSFLSVILLGGTLFWFVLPRMQDSLLAEKKQMTREMVNLGLSILAECELLERAGIISRNAAQAEALQRLKALRYGPENKDYFWILDFGPNMLMHPFREELENTNVHAFKDMSGKHIFQEMRRIAGEKGEGFVDYYWQWKDDPGRIVPKVSFIKVFGPWKWIIGTGLYIEDVKAEMRSLTGKLTLVSVLVLVMVSLLALYITLRGLSLERASRQAKLSLKESEEKFRGISANALDGIIMIDQQGKVSFWNQAAERIFGYFADEVLGEHGHLLLAPDVYHEKYHLAFEQFGRSGTGPVVGKTLELTARHKDGSDVPIELSVSTLSLRGKWHALGVVL